VTSPTDTATPAVPATCLPPWDVADLPDPPPRTWRNWTSLIGPGIVMMGIQIGGGEWLFGPEITARYGGGLMWIATIAIVLQVFYNVECGRYALYCGEPIMTGFMRTRPGPAFWMGVVLLLSVGALIPGLSTHAAAIIAALYLGRPPTFADSSLVTVLAYVCLAAVVLPVLVGGKVYNTLQAVMTAKVLFVLGFCVTIGVLFVSPANWWNVFSGFVRFGNVPVADGAGGETVANLFTYYRAHDAWPVVSLASIAVLGAFAGYAGGGGLSNSTYSN
jgi:Mn2+/Fe2+ NRAMP family transporter